MYARIQNNEIVEWPILDIRRRLPMMSLPAVITKESLPENFVEVVPSPHPEYDTLTHEIKMGIPYLDGDQWIQSWEVFPLDQEIVEKNISARDIALREQAKRERAETVERIRVTTQSGKIFDGDEISQTRMARAIIALQATNTPTVTWVLADNTPTQATVEELVEALALAGAAQASIWVI